MSLGHSLNPGSGWKLSHVDRGVIVPSLPLLLDGENNGLIHIMKLLTDKKCLIMVLK